MAASSSAAPVVDAAVWYSVAGTTVQIPPPNSYVYYFPEGHLEQHHYPPSPSDSATATAGAAVENLNINVNRPIFPCRVLSSDLLYNPHSDQAYAKMLLQPSYTTGDHHPNKDKSVVEPESDVVWHAKILTASDANNGGGFSVPRCCADSVFPRLDFAADPPLQTLRIRDGHGSAWEFRHIYRGTPRRHLLTTGWSKFVNAKRLIAGDAVVFMRRKSSNELFIGIRRANGKFGGISNSSGAGEAVAAMEKAAKGMVFEVSYYPRAGLPDFVVSAARVEAAFWIRWSAGMRVAMEVETEDSTRMVSAEGTVMAVASPESGPWRGSPWRSLQVTWDQDVPEVLPKNKGVCPWQVVYVPSTSHLHPDFPLLKKLKPSPNQGSSTMMVLTAGDSEFPFPSTQSSTRQMVATGLDYPLPLPAGMQGARPDERDNNSPRQTFTQLLTNCIEPETKTAVPEILHPHSENFLPGGSQSSVQLHGADLVGSNSSTEAGLSSFRLFGQTIRTSEPADGEGQINVAIDPPHDSLIRRVDGQF